MAQGIMFNSDILNTDNVILTQEDNKTLSNKLNEIDNSINNIELTSDTVILPQEQNKTLTTKLDEIDTKIESSSSAKKLVATFDTAGTHTWTIPDWVKSKGKVDVFMMGGGGSGGIARYRTSTGSTVWYNSAIRGGAGYVNKLTDFDISSKTTITIVVGKGGAGTDPGTSNFMTGIAGGTTSFDGKKAEGGEGYTADSDASMSGANGSSGSGACSGTQPTRSGFYGQDGGDTSLYSGGNGQGAYVINYNDIRHTYSSAGGGAGGYNNKTEFRGYKTDAIATDYGKGGDGYYGTSSVPSGVNATGYGNGGGGIVTSASGTMNLGAGSDGVVLIYA